MPEHIPLPWKRKKMTSDLIIFNDMGRIVASFERSIELDFALLSANYHDRLLEALRKSTEEKEIILGWAQAQSEKRNVTLEIGLPAYRNSVAKYKALLAEIEEASK